jgi:threonine dehydratase
VGGCSPGPRRQRPRCALASGSSEWSRRPATTRGSRWPRGERIAIAVPKTIADGQQATTPGELTFAVNRRLTSEIVVVSDAEIIEALRFAVDRLKTVLEPSGAIGIAALLAGRVADLAGRRVGVILSGGNIGAARLADLLTR